MSLDFAAAGPVPGGSRRNLRAVEPDCSFDERVPAAARALLADAQTSGGLLVSVAAARAGALVRRLEELGTPAAAAIGRLEARPSGGPLISVVP